MSLIARKMSELFDGSLQPNSTVRDLMQSHQHFHYTYSKKYGIEKRSPLNLIIYLSSLFYGIFFQGAATSLAKGQIVCNKMSPLRIIF